MSKWKQELIKQSYTISGNGKVLDDKDAEKVAVLAHNEALDSVKTVLEKIFKEPADAELIKRVIKNKRIK